eukprot:2298028-Alexandrium_andersonii.AAC.1
MSASLVGSEMCIRDRSGAHSLQTGPMIAREGIAAGRRTPSCLKRWVSETCLLYTSDAADDM